MIGITPLVLTSNEQDNIGRTLQALTWASKVVLIDSGSTDRTLEIAHAMHPNICVFQRSFDTHTEQWNFGLDQVRTPWVLSLDADYEISPELQADIERLEPSDDVAGYAARFQFRVFGRPLRGSVYPPRTVLFRQNRARYYSDGHTQLLRCEGSVHMLAGLIYHDDRKPLSRWLVSQDRYMLIEAPHLLKGNRAGLRVQDRIRRRGTWAALVMFLYLLFGKRLILDGWAGWHYTLQRTLAEALLALRIIVEREGLEQDSKDG
jgi:glycosyltransferase involved in cell wall biosynthesis